MRFYNKSLNQISKSDLLEAFIEFYQGKAIDYPSDSPESKEKEIKYCLTVITAPEAGAGSLIGALTSAFTPLLALNNTYELAAHLFYSIYNDSTYGHKAFHRVMQDIINRYEINQKRFLKYLINSERAPENSVILQTSSVKLEFYENQITYNGTPHTLQALQISVLKALATKAPDMIDMPTLEKITDKQTLQTTISKLRAALGEPLIKTYTKNNKTGGKTEGYGLTLKPSEIYGLRSCETST